MKPYKFAPYLKQTIWGGDRIASYKGIDTPLTNIGESWEICSIGGHDSIITEGGCDDGSDVGLTLSQLIARHNTALMGFHVYAMHGNNFPLIAKFLDSRETLSIQVHPNGELARERHNSYGKDEMWYIVEAQPDASIICGFRENTTPEAFLKAVHTPTGEDGTHALMNLVSTYESKAGEVFFLPSGVIHALGAGNLVSEVQQASDITYRIFDYNRRDKDGNLRQLHIDEAVDAINYNATPECHIQYDENDSEVSLVRSSAFYSYRIAVKGESVVDFRCDSFVLVMCMKGTGELNGTSMGQGETLLVPASDNRMEIKGNCELLVVYL